VARAHCHTANFKTSQNSQVDDALALANQGIQHSLAQHFGVAPKGILMLLYKKVLKDIVAGEVRVAKRHKFQLSRFHRI